MATGRETLKVQDKKCCPRKVETIFATHFTFKWNPLVFPLKSPPHSDAEVFLKKNVFPETEESDKSTKSPKLDAFEAFIKKNTRKIRVRGCFIVKYRDTTKLLSLQIILGRNTNTNFFYERRTLVEHRVGNPFSIPLPSFLGADGGVQSEQIQQITPSPLPIHSAVHRGIKERLQSPGNKTHLASCVGEAVEWW